MNELISELTYSSYRYNRDRSPEITPEQWAKIFPNSTALEARYQSDPLRKHDTLPFTPCAWCGQVVHDTAPGLPQLCRECAEKQNVARGMYDG